MLIISEQEHSIRPNNIDIIMNNSSSPTKAVTFATHKSLYLIEHRSEISSQEKSTLWYSSNECQRMAKNAGLHVLRQSYVEHPQTIGHVDSQTVGGSTSPETNKGTIREETRGLEQFLSPNNYKAFKNARKERIKAVLEAQRQLRSFGVKDHSWAIHLACARESVNSTMRASMLGLQDEAIAFQIYRDG
jgi:hypothetical protein